MIAALLVGGATVLLLALCLVCFTAFEVFSKPDEIGKLWHDGVNIRKPGQDGPV